MIPKVPLLNQSFFLFFSSQQIHLQPEITTFILFSNRCQVALSPLPSAILRNITVHFSTVTLQHTRELATLQGAKLAAIFHFSQLNLALFFCFLKTSCFFGLLRLSASIEIAVENCFSLIPTAVVFTPCWGIQGLQKRMEKKRRKDGNTADNYESCHRWVFFPPQEKAASRSLVVVSNCSKNCGKYDHDFQMTTSRSSSFDVGKNTGNS